MQKYGDTICHIAAGLVGWFLVAYAAFCGGFLYSAFYQPRSVRREQNINNFEDRVYYELRQQDLRGLNPDYLEALILLETGRGTSEPYKKGHNLFNIKATMGCIPGPSLCYRMYRSDSESISDFVRLITIRQRYRQAYIFALRDQRKQFFQALQDAGYAEDNQYAQDAERVFQELKCEEIRKRFN